MFLRKFQQTCWLFQMFSLCCVSICHFWIFIFTCVCAKVITILYPCVLEKKKQCSASHSAILEMMRSHHFVYLEYLKKRIANFCYFACFNKISASYANRKRAFCAFKTTRRYMRCWDICPHTPTNNINGRAS